MRKHKVGHLPQPQAKPLLADDPKQDLERAHEVTEHALVTVQQLRSLSHTISAVGPTLGDEPTIEAKHVVHTMALFAQSLDEVQDLLEEVRALMETANPALLAVNE